MKKRSPEGGTEALAVEAPEPETGTTCRLPVSSNRTRRAACSLPRVMSMRGRIGFRII